MCPINPQHNHDASAARSTTTRPKIKILDSNQTASPSQTRHAVALLLLMSGICSSLAAHHADAAVLGVASFNGVLPQKIAWHTCEGNPANTDCAQVQVPLDWDHPNGPEISLALARHRAGKPNERIGSLFINYGGPGVPGVPAVLAAGASLDKLGAGRFDVVGWDPRGTGQSTHIRCFQNEKSMEQFWGEDWTIPTTPASEWRYVPKTLAYVVRCTARSGSLLEHTSTADTVRDLDYLRQLVGDARITYRGLSYGTFLGQTYINMFPQNVRAIILDANIDPVPYTTSVEAALFNNGADTDLVFEKFLSLCEQAGQANCKLAGDGDVAARVRALLARLRKGPIPAPRGPAPYELRYGDLLVDIWSMLGGPEKWPELADELIGNKYDPRTKYANSVQASRRLGNAVLLTLQGYGKPALRIQFICLVVLSRSRRSCFR